MAEPRNGYEYLKQLTAKKEAARHSFHDYFKFLDAKARVQGVPIHGQFELTPLCNFSCRMCYVHLTKDQMLERHLLTVQQWKDIIHQAWEAGMIRATLTGGECLTYPGFKDIYMYLRDLGCEVSVLTNGYLIDEEWIQFFQKNKPMAMQITLYGQNEDVYERVTGQRGFTKVTENIRKMMEAELPVSLAVTPSKYLGNDIFETIRFGESMKTHLNVNSYLMPPRKETGRSGQKDDLNIDFYVRLWRFLDKKEGEPVKVIPERELPPIGGPAHECSECGLQCGGGRSCFNIDWKGNMCPCNQLAMVESYPLEIGFAEAWKQINQAVENWPRVAECEGCAYAPLCSQCAARMLQYVEPGKQPIPMCEEVRYLVHRGAWHIPECDT